MTEEDRLPPPAWFTIEEVARRWNCKIEQVIHYAEADMLRISVRPGCVSIFMVSQQITESGGEESRNNAPFSGGPFGVPSSAIRSIWSNREYVLKGVCPPVISDNELDSDEIRPFASFVFAKAKDLIVVAEEVSRFEQLHRICAHAGELPAPKPELGERERQTLLRLVGALNETLLDKGPFKSQSELVDYLVEEYGVTKRTTDGKLSEAKKALQNK